MTRRIKDLLQVALLSLRGSCTLFVRTRERYSQRARPTYRAALYARKSSTGRFQLVMQFWRGHARSCTPAENELLGAAANSGIADETRRRDDEEQASETKIETEKRTEVPFDRSPPKTTRKAVENERPSLDRLLGVFAPHKNAQERTEWLSTYLFFRNWTIRFIIEDSVKS